MRYDMKRKVHTISPGIAGSQITFSLKLDRNLLIENNERINEDAHNLLVASHKFWQTTVLMDGLKRCISKEQAIDEMKSLESKKDLQRFLEIFQRAKKNAKIVWNSFALREI